MQDIETKSLWSQVSGEGIQGDFAGRKLTLFNSSHSSYKEFKKQYPKGLLLRKPEGIDASPYESYFSDSSKLGMFGRVDDFQRLNGKDKVFGLHLPDGHVAVSRKLLAEKGHAWIEQDTQAVLVTFDSATEAVAAFVFDPTGNPKQGDVSVVDRSIIAGDGQTTWNAFTGEMESGQGQKLESIPVLTAYWFAWFSFFPDTELVQ